MATNLLIVESPAKAKTLEKYLGKQFKVLASYGHVRDLVPKQGAVDPENHFKMKYQPIEKNEKHVDSIIKQLEKADTLYLASDPDREGEAIAWHLFEMLRERHLLTKKTVHRVVFNQITKNAVLEAIEHPRELSTDLVNAQQARRALDYLVGFNLSPLLWKKVRRGLSAGRVQSPALAMIVKRELEIEAFVAQEYWSINALLKEKKSEFKAKLVLLKNEKLEQFSITTAKQAEEIKTELEKAANGMLVVEKLEKKQRKRNPTAPFITSTLQQEAARKIGFSAQRTMRIAQQLYEGIDIGSGATGLITYMRTDSVTLAQEALTEIRDLIQERYGKENLPDEPRMYKTRAKNAQEAHEAIRPTSVHNIPDTIKSFLSPDQYKLYSLIWKRTVASQMESALIDTLVVHLRCGTPDTLFKTTGSTVVKPGFLAVYEEGIDDNKKTEEEEDESSAVLPPLKEGQEITLREIVDTQHFTEPPPRYSEATLVKALEEYGIGRPSTYASIISTLQTREYAELDNKRFKPTDVGRIVNKFLTDYFAVYIDYGFTAKLEDELDAIARGEKEWVPLLTEFWAPFKTQVTLIDETIKRSDVTHESLDEACPKCSKPLSIRLGKRGRFIGCSGYPECDYTRNVDETAETATTEIVEGRDCPECQSALQIRNGRYGKFIGCTAYPKCKHIEPLEKPADTGVTCPECHEGTMLQRRSRYGKIFFSCGRYPKCTYAVWNTPVAEQCAKCAWPILTIKVTKRRGTEKVCPQKSCGHAESVETTEEDPSV